MSHTKLSQQCAICGAVQPLTARTCGICGAKLKGQPTSIMPIPAVKDRSARDVRLRYDPAEGEDDLFAGDLSGRMWRLILAAAVVLALSIGIGVGVIVGKMGHDDRPTGQGGPAEMLTPDRPTAPPTATSRGELPGVSLTATSPPTMALATITPAPPTPTDTPTPGPCLQTAKEGDTVYGLAILCGHQDMAVVDLILQMNNMKSPAELQVGQTLEIPWPTPTPGGDTGAALPAPAETKVNQFGTPDVLAIYQVEPTLRPGQAWYVVQEGDTILSIAIQYNTSIETLSQINPEIPFLKCDYSSASGGQNCTVILNIGDRVRVPVPLPSQTPTPSPVGTLTPTPTITATYNAPYPILPEDRAHFDADQIVTLRWGGTGTLAENERYLVRVRDLDTGEENVATVRDTTYILPGGWQPADGKPHHLEWTISVAAVDAQNNILSEVHATDPRPFIWDSR